MFSGGIGSWATARLVAQEHGAENVILLFSDVKGVNQNPHIGEDEDTYRFINDAAANIGSELVILKDGRDIWEVFKDHNFLGNSRIAHCSFDLKQKPARRWLKENSSPENTIVYVGIDWTEVHRLPAIVKNYKPWIAKAPLTEPPYIDKQEWIELAKKEGLRTPRLYDLGFAHNNCGGGCVRAGQGQFKKLYEIMPERFKVWEEKEQEVREHIGKDVSILTEVVKGEKRPLLLSELRRRIEDQPMIVDDYDIGGCGCFFEQDERKNEVDE